MSGRIKIADRDWTLDPGPFSVTGVQFSGAIPGGHGSASFDVPVSSAYLAPYHTLKEGQWIVIYGDDGSELYEGEIFTVAPSLDATTGAAKLSITCGGLISIAGKRADVSKTWVHRGPADWKIMPGGNTNGDYSFDNGVIDLRARAGDSTNFSTTAGTGGAQLAAMFALDEELSDALMTYVKGTFTWDVTNEGGSQWAWTLVALPSLNGTPTWLDREIYTSGGPVTRAYTPPVGTKVLVLLLNEGSQHTISADRFVTIADLEVYSGWSDPPTNSVPRTTKARIDQAMVELATRPGLATSYVSSPVGAPMNDLHVGNGLAKVTAASALSTVAGFYAQPFEWGFWDARTFYCNPQSTNPDNDARVVLVGGGNPGLVSWDVTEADEDVPDYACVLYGNLDNAAYPEGWTRRLYRPTSPPDNADLKIKLVDYSQYILSDASAANIGDNIVSVSSTSLPPGYTLDAQPNLASGGKAAGNNTDPTSSYQDAYSVSVSGALSGFAYTTSSGWAGSNSSDDPSCLVGDGVNDYVDWGNVAALNVGTGAFSLRAWVQVVAAPQTDAVTVASKLSSGQGFALKVTSALHVLGYVGNDAVNYRQQTGSTTLVVGNWYHIIMTYGGSGGDIALYISGVAESLTPTGSVGAWNLTNAASLLMLRGN